MSRSSLAGYLDDLSAELYAEEPEVIPEQETLEATNMEKEKIANHGVGDWSGYVEFDDFDGGDGQQGCVGDGKMGLDKFGDDYQAQIVNSQAQQSLQQSRQNKSNVRSARVAWGANDGYAETLRDKGMETARAQQLENWANQQEIRRKTQEVERMAEADQVSNHDEDWRMLSKFGAERVTDTDLDQLFGSTEIGGDVEGTIEMQSSMNRAETHSFTLKNPFMGYAEYRASFTADSSPDFSVTPAEGSLSKTPVEFIVRFRPSAPIVNAQGFLVIETEDFKKTWRVLGTTG